MSPMLPLVLLGFPVLDTLTVMVERITAGRSSVLTGQEPLPSQADASGAVPHRGGDGDLRRHCRSRRRGGFAAVPLRVALDRRIRSSSVAWSSRRLPRLKKGSFALTGAGFSTWKSRAGSR